MSLKNTVKKSLAILGVITLLSGNCSLCGLGISKVIAENLSAPGITIELNNEKYVQHAIKKENIEESHSGVALQTKLSLTAKQVKDEYMPTKTAVLEMNMPEIKGYLPERASIAKASTEATTGELNNLKINQSYSKESGLLTVSYENVDEEGNILYSEYKENAKDEFEIIYIYPQEAYVGNEEEIKLDYKVKVTATYKNNDSEVISQEETNIQIKEKENKGDITTFAVTELQEKIYKGFMYSNVKNKTNYDTNYKTVSTMTILNSDIVNEIVMKSEEDKFILNDKEETSVLAKENIVYTTTGIKKEEFDKILGQEGIIEFYENEEVTAQVKYIDVEEENETVKRLAVIYSDDNVEILSKEDTIALVKHKEGKTNLTIKTTKPVSEGFLNFENENTIKASKDYGCKIEEIKYINSKTSINDYEIDTKIALSEPETKISVEASNTNFPTLQKSKTTLTIKLDDTNAATKLYDNPTIIVKLPEGLKGGNLSSPDILNGNGLKIKDTEAKDNTITIKLEGKQTQYDINNVSGGVNIVMDIENIDFEDTTPTHADKIEVECTQGKEKTTTSCDVNIVSKEELLIVSTISNYKDYATEITTIDNTVAKALIEKDADSRVANAQINLVNNYDVNLTQVELVGELGYSNEEKNSTFVTLLNNNIQTNIGEILYSIDNENWSTDYKNAKYFKLKLENDEIKKQEVINLNLEIVIPEKLQYNQESYINCSVKYLYDNNIVNGNSTISLATQRTTVNTYALLTNAITLEENIENYEKISITDITTSGEKVIDNGETIFEGTTLHHVVTIKNISSETLNNINLVTTVNNGVFYVLTASTETLYGGIHPHYYMEDATLENITKNINILESGETYTFEYEYVVNQIEGNNNKVESNIQVNAENMETVTKTFSNVIKEAELKINSKYYKNEEDLMYSQAASAFFVKIQNISGKNLENIKVKIELPDFIQYNSKEEINGETIEIKDNTIYYTISLEKGGTKTLNVPVKTSAIDVSEESIDISFIATAEVNQNKYYSNIVEKTVYQSASGLSIHMSSDKDVQTEIKDGDYITYTIKLKNPNQENLTVEVSDTIPKGLLIKNIYIDGKSKMVLNSEYFNQTIIVSSNSEKTIQIRALFNQNYLEENQTQITNFASAYVEESSEGELYSNTITHNIKMIEKDDDPIDDNIDQIIGEETEENPKEESPEQSEEEDSKNSYSIFGIAWLDLNNDGKRQDSELGVSNIEVYLYDYSTGNIAIDSLGNKAETITTDVGYYEFKNLNKGNYIVIFKYDTSKYSVTTYQKNGVQASVNSDAITSKIQLEGTIMVAGVTNKIQLKSNETNIDIGLIENASFDLSLNKYISQVDVINSQGDSSYTWEKSNTAKVDFVAKYINTASIAVTYKFVITNNGDVVGYVNKLEDDLPSGLEFNSELNKDWYKGSDGVLYTTALNNIAIEPGQSTQIELVLTKNMTENNTGVIPNNAKLSKISNIQNINENNTQKENNQSSADLILSIKTGSVVLYVTITIICLAIIGIGTFLIKKNVLNKGE